MPADMVWETIRSAAGTHLNREMVDIFLGVLPPYPVGTMVEVTSGTWAEHRAVVAKVHAEAMHRPVIRVLVNAAGERVEPVDVDLRDNETSIRGLAGQQIAVS
jgi:hypothetical protein